MKNKMHKEINEIFARLDELADEINKLKARDFNDLKIMIQDYEALWETLDIEFGDELDEQQKEELFGKHFENLEFFTKLT